MERYARHACDQLNIQRRGAYGLRTTAVCEFVDIKCALGYTDAEARHELALLSFSASAFTLEQDRRFLWIEVDYLPFAVMTDAFSAGSSSRLVS